MATYGNDLPPAAAGLSRFCTSCGQAALSGQFCAGCGAEIPDPGGDGLLVGWTDKPVPHVPAQVVPGSAPDDLSTVSLPLPWPEPTVELDDKAGAAPMETADPVRSRYARLLATRRGQLIAATSVLVVLALLAGGLGMVRYINGSNVRTALNSSGDDFDGVVNKLSVATNLAQVSVAVSESPRAARRIGTALSKLGEVSGPKETAVRAQLEAERGVLQGIAELDGLGTEPLKSWGRRTAG